MKRTNSVPIETIFNAAEQDPSGAHPLLRRAEVIYAVGEPAEGDVLLYGKEKIRRIADSDCPEGARVLRVAVGPERQDFHRLLQLVRQAKGTIDYAEPA